MNSALLFSTLQRVRAKNDIQSDFTTNFCYSLLAATHHVPYTLQLQCFKIARRVKHFTRKKNTNNKMIGQDQTICFSVPLKSLNCAYKIQLGNSTETLYLWHWLHLWYLVCIRLCCILHHASCTVTTLNKLPQPHKNILVRKVCNIPVLQCNQFCSNLYSIDQNQMTFNSHCRRELCSVMFKVSVCLNHKVIYRPNEQNGVNKLMLSWWMYEKMQQCN